MTSTYVPTDQLPLINPFLNTICPGFTNQLEHNTHFSLKDEHFNNGELSINWPLNASNTTARLDDTYLNIARPPLSITSNESTTYVSLPYHITNVFKKVVKSKDKQMEGNIHIGANVNPLSHDPFKIINLNPGCLTNILDLNSFNSSSIKLNYSNDNNSNSNQDLSSRNPFNKLTTNFNRLLKITSSANSTNNSNNTIIDPYNDFRSLLDVIESPKSSTNGNGNSNHNNATNNSNNHLISKIVEYNPQTYLAELRSQTTAKLLISTNVNVLNIIAIDTNANYKFTKSITTNKPIIPFPEDPQTSQPTQTPQLPTTNGNSTSPSKPSEYTKVIEESLLRIQFRPNSIITSLKSVINKNRDPLIVLGFDTGEVLLLNLVQLKYQIFDDLGFTQQKHSSDASSIHSRSSNGIGKTNLNYSSNFSNVAATTLELIHHPNFEMLILAGYANGEVIIIDPYASKPPSTTLDTNDKTSTASTHSNNSNGTVKYNKRIVGKDSFITYFKKFDLSPFTKNKSLVNSIEADHYSPSYLIGHFKLSLKPITSITSTLLYSTYVAADEFTHKLDNQPMIIAIGGDDGIIRFIDLIFTHNRNYGNSPQDIKTNSSILTDLISNYFNDGITDVEFSPDYRFICVVGKGDLIEIFKMSYYNVNGLLTKNSSTNYNTASTDNIGGSVNITAGRRSRSGTVNSVGSNNPQQSGANAQLFLSPISTTPSNNYEATRNDHNGTPRLSNYQAKELYPPLIKEIKIVGRFKGHTNTIRSIKFLEVEDDELERSGSNNVTYKLISCGFDGKVIIWEFDYKALPKVKNLTTSTANKDKEGKDQEKDKEHRSPKDESRERPRKRKSIHIPGLGSGALANALAAAAPGGPNAKIPVIHTSSPGPGGRLSAPALKSNTAALHNRTRSMSGNDDFPSTILNNPTSLGSMNMTTILAATSSNTLNESVSRRSSRVMGEEKSTDQIEIVTSLYKSLFDLRLKRHYRQFLKKGVPIKFTAIIPPIVNDKLVPSIRVPLLSLDLSSFIHDGKIDGFHLDAYNFWIFGKSGDIFKYTLR